MAGIAASYGGDLAFFLPVMAGIAASYGGGKFI